MAAAKPKPRQDKQKAAKSSERNGSNKEGWPGAFDAVGQVFQKLMLNPEPAVFFAVTYVVFTIASSVAQHRMYGSKGYIGYEDILALVFLVSLPTYALALVEGRKVSISDIMEFNPRTWLVMLVATIIAAVAIAGSIFLLIFPVIWVAAWFGVYQYAVIIEGVGPIEALKASKQLTQNHKALVWGIFGATIVLAIPEIILSYIPYFKYLTVAYNEIVAVMVSGATAMLYLHLKDTVKD